MVTRRLLEGWNLLVVGVECAEYEKIERNIYESLECNKSADRCYNFLYIQNMKI